MTNRPSKLDCPSDAHPFVRLLFDEMRKKGMSISDLAIKSGVDRNTISSWRRRGTMTLNSMECCLGVFGLHLMPVPDPKHVENAVAKMSAYKVTMAVIKQNAENILKIAS